MIFRVDSLENGNRCFVALLLTEEHIFSCLPQRLFIMPYARLFCGASAHQASDSLHTILPLVATPNVFYAICTMCPHAMKFREREELTKS